ncbi:Uncharacterized protein YejA, partial [Durusdinium trenchii]
VGSTCIAIAGVALTVVEDLDLGGTLLVGDALEIGAGITWAVFLVASSRAMQASQTTGERLNFLFGVFTVAAVLLTPLGLAGFVVPPAEDLLPLLFLGVLATAVAYYFWYEAAAELSTLTATLLFALSVGFTFVNAALFLGTEIRPQAVLGAAMIVFAIFLTQANDTTAETAADTTTAHGISAFGELKYPPDFPHFDYVNPDAPRGGVLSFRGQGASRTFDSLNAYILSGEPAQGLERLSDSLLVRAFDEPDAVYGLIAESVEYPEDRSWAIFNMRPEARFSDGEPITAEDVVWTLTTLRDEGAPLYRIGLRDVETVTALDDHRVRVDFREGAAMRDLIAT